MKTVTEARGRPSLEGRRIDLRWTPPPASDFAPASPLTGIRVVRRTRSYPRDPTDGTIVYDGAVVAELSDGGLDPLTTYYYTIFARETGPVFHADDGSYVAAFATERYDLARRLYELLPAVHLRYDRPLGAAAVAQLGQSNSDLPAALAALPPELRGAGQLRRFLHAAGAPADLMRSLAEGLRQVQVPDVARPEFLPHLASFAGWELDSTLPVESQRNEVKFAPYLYRSVGTVRSLRTIVSRYTGWHTQAAEFAEHIYRSNEPAQLNVFAIVERPSGWRGADDAAPALGLVSAAAEAGAPVVTGTVTEPFALRPGMEIAMAADDRLPTVVRFGEGDFTNIGAATAAEVVAVLSRTAGDVTSSVVAGRIRLASQLSGPSASVRVERYEASLVTLEGAPAGRLASFRDSGGRTRLLYVTADPLDTARRHDAARAAAGKRPALGMIPGRTVQPALDNIGTTPARVQPTPIGRLRLKTFRNAWGAAIPVPTTGAAADPAGVSLPGGRVLVAWIEEPLTSSAVVRAALGTTRVPRPARLRGTRSQTFRIVPGMQLVVRGTWDGPSGAEFVGTDFANPAAATAAEVVAALARLQDVTASVQAGTVVLESALVGGNARLELDLGQSTAAAALGFGAGNSSAHGGWGDEIDWDVAQDVAPPGRITDVAAFVEAGGAVRLFWAAHDGASWQIVGARWDGVASPPVWTPMVPAVLAQGGGGVREPFAVLGQPNRLWLFWSQRDAAGTADDIWTLRRAVLDLTTEVWSAPAVVTTPAIPRSADREPSAVVLPTGNIRLLFRSDRGGDRIWSLEVTPGTGTATAPVTVTSGPYHGSGPSPFFIGPRLWLAYRSDRSVPLSRVGTREVPRPQNRITYPAERADEPPGLVRSGVAPDAGTVRRYAGSTTVIPGDTARLSRRRLFGDALAYTTQGTDPRQDLGNDDLYTRGTVGLYLSRLIPDTPLTQQKVDRLNAILSRFIPINVRVVVVLAPRFDVEFVYDGVDIDERVTDVYPEIEYYGGLDDQQAVDLLPNWVLFRSFAPPAPPAHLTVAVADPTTLRHRSWHRIYFPPPV